MFSTILDKYDADLLVTFDLKSFKLGQGQLNFLTQ